MPEVREARILQIALLLVAISVSAAPARAKYGGGAGEPNDPFLIYTPEQMNAIGAEPNDWGSHFKLIADIDLSAYKGNQFNLIGTYLAEESPNDRPFTGVFDGNGHVISHFTYVSADQNEIGLFRHVGDGNSEIRDLTLADPNISVPGGYNVGSLVGYLKHGALVRCRITGGSVSGEENVGGLVGKDGCDVTRVPPDSLVYPHMSECCFTGTVSGKRSVGGLVGYNRTGQIISCYATGHVRGSDRAGGLAGVSMRGYIEACYAIVAVAGENAVGGLVGECLSMIRNSHAAGSVTGREQIGGLVGSGSHTVVGAFWDAQTSGQPTSAGGTAKTTAQMQASATFLSWNVDGNQASWTIDEGRDYPRLGWEGRPGEMMEAAELAEVLKGTGEIDDPYLIYTAEELNLIALYWRENNKHFKLMADLDMGIYTGDQFNIIYQFSGTFDGNHHTIANLTYRVEARDWVGLFGTVYDGWIKDLEFVTPVIDSGTGYGVGALVGSVRRATITNCRVNGGTISGGTFVGGTVGANSGSVFNCHASADVMAAGYVGGLLGRNSGSVSYCSAAGSVSGKQTTGGLAGDNMGRIEGCYATGSVEGNTNIGGLAGYNDYDGAIVDCYASGRVTGEDRVGGLVGSSDGTVAYCYATGSIVGAHGSEVGGLVGYELSSGATFASFWDTKTSGMSSSAGGEGRTTVQMQQESTFTGWGEDGAWTIDEGRDYPRLAWENQPGEPITIPALASVVGTGGQDDPYLISTAEQLNLIGLFPSTWDKHFKLVADIDLSAYPGTSFNIIGTRALPFAGVFDGSDHTISHFSYECPDQDIAGFFRQDYVGFFRYVGGPNAEIHSLVLEEANINVDPWWYWSSQLVGSLVGYLADGAVKDCRVTGSVSGDCDVGGLVGYCGDGGRVVNCHTIVAVQGWWRTGGLVGGNDGTVMDCSSGGTINGAIETGGLIGVNHSTVVNCRATSAVSGQNSVGGLVGGNSINGTIAGCHATGNADANDWAGGLAGYNLRGTIRDSYAAGSVTSNEYAGGLVGGNDGMIRGCHASGTVTSRHCTGGLLGAHFSTVSDSYATGRVDGHEDAGGLIGANLGDATNCYAAGRVSGSEWVGGLVGYEEQGTFITCFWDIVTTGQLTSLGGAGKTTEEMQTAATFLDAGWDFVGEAANGEEDIWRIREGQDYPRLWWETDGD